MTHPLHVALERIGDGPSGEPVKVDRPRYVSLPPYRATAEELREMVARRIPRRFAWARWEAPLMAERVRGGARKVALVREAMSRRARVVLVGPSGAGKTALACAWLAERIFAGAHCGFFVPDRVLLQVGTNRDGVERVWFDCALTARPLVLDNFGTLYGAPKGSGLAAQRIMAVSRLIQERHDRGLGHVVTTDRGKDRIELEYGDDIARRLFDGATEIEIA